VSLEYQRSYYQGHDVRVISGQTLVYRAARPSLIAGSAVHDLSVAIEVTAPAGDDLDRLMNAFPFPRADFSKYERAARAIYPRGA